MSSTVIETDLDSFPLAAAWKHYRRLRRQFNSDFAQALRRHWCQVEVPGRSIDVYWADETGLYRAYVGAYFQRRVSDGRPWVLRIRISACSSYTCGIPAYIPRRLGVDLRAPRREWKLELSVLPRELLGFPNWLADWVFARSDDSIALPDPPHPCTFRHRQDNYVWTKEAEILKDKYWARKHGA